MDITKRITRVAVVSPMHPVWVGDKLCWPVDGRGVIDETGTLYCTDKDADAVHERLNGRFRADTDEKGQWL